MFFSCHNTVSIDIAYKCTVYNTPITIASNLASQYKQLPRTNLDGAYRLANNLEINLGNEYTVFDNDDDFFFHAPEGSAVVERLGCR